MRALVLLLVAALAWQSFVGGIHRHAAPAPFASAAHAASLRQGDASDILADCAICGATARAGLYLAALPPVIDAPGMFGFGAPVMPRARRRRRCRSHGWHSRGPPRGDA